MLRLGLALRGHVILAEDGKIGSVSDILFDDQTWRVRWLVVDTGNWLPGRKVLLHPSCVTEIDGEGEFVRVGLSQSQVQASPDIMTDQPVSRQMEFNLFRYYGWDPMWGAGLVGPVGMASPTAPPPYFDGLTVDESVGVDALDRGGDAHLQSLAAIIDYHVHASDGEIGHVQNFVIDDATWHVAYLMVATRNWWPGPHVLIAPPDVTAIDWAASLVSLRINRAAVKQSPAWDPSAQVETEDVESPLP